MSRRPEPALPSGRRLGDLKILEEIGRGGQAIVYRGVDGMGQERAVKVFSPSGLDSNCFLSRLAREADALRRLSDPGVPRLHGAVATGEAPHLVMDLVRGRSLDGLLRAKTSDASGHWIPVNGGSVGILRLIENLARTVHRIHQAGVVHRDLKPGNVIVGDDGRPVLIDFGVAVVDPQNAPRLTPGTDIFGTPESASPEHLRGRRPSPSMDIWALGVLLYEALTGELPFVGESSYELAERILSGEPTPPSRCQRGLPRGVDRVVGKALEKRRRDRYPTALAFAEDLARLRAGRTPGAPPRWRRRLNASLYDLRAELSPRRLFS